MIIVIQCAGRKQKDKGYLQGADGRRMVFVDDPATAPISDAINYAHPDDMSPHGRTWRQLLVEYNETPSQNSEQLLPAYQLYRPKVYQELVEMYGANKIYILSAGWGLVPSTFLLPQYNITYARPKELYKWRRPNSAYNDLVLVPENSTETLVFMGGKSYQKPFFEFTKAHRGRRIVFYNAKPKPEEGGCTFIEYPADFPRNWHYSCAQELMDGTKVLAE